MPYIFGKLWHLAIIWALRKAFQCILQGVRILLANHTRISPTSENDSYEPFQIISQITYFKCSSVGILKSISNRIIYVFVQILRQIVNTQNDTIKPSWIVQGALGRIPQILKYSNTQILKYSNTQNHTIKPSWIVQGALRRILLSPSGDLGISLV